MMMIMRLAIPTGIRGSGNPLRCKLDTISVDGGGRNEVFDKIWRLAHWKYDTGASVRSTCTAGSYSLAKDVRICGTELSQCTYEEHGPSRSSFCLQE